MGVYKVETLDLQRCTESKKYPVQIEVAYMPWTMAHSQRNIDVSESLICPVYVGLFATTYSP